MYEFGNITVLDELRTGAIPTHDRFSPSSRTRSAVEALESNQINADGDKKVGASTSNTWKLDGRGQHVGIETKTSVAACVERVYGSSERLW